MGYQPTRDPAPLVAEFTSWQKRTGRLLSEWVMENWVAKGFEARQRCYQFMHYWVNHEARLALKERQRKKDRNAPKMVRRNRLLEKYGKENYAGLLVRVS